MFIVPSPCQVADFRLNRYVRTSDTATIIGPEADKELHTYSLLCGMPAFCSAASCVQRQRCRRRRVQARSLAGGEYAGEMNLTGFAL